MITKTSKPKKKAENKEDFVLSFADLSHFVSGFLCLWGDVSTFIHSILHSTKNEANLFILNHTVSGTTLGLISAK